MKFIIFCLLLTSIYAHDACCYGSDDDNSPVSTRLIMNQNDFNSGNFTKDIGLLLDIDKNRINIDKVSVSDIVTIDFTILSRDNTYEKTPEQAVELLMYLVSSGHYTYTVNGNYIHYHTHASPTPTNGLIWVGIIGGVLVIGGLLIFSSSTNNRKKRYFN